MLLAGNYAGLGFNNPKALNQMLHERKREKDTERDKRIGVSETRGIISVFMNAGATVVFGEKTP